MVAKVAGESKISTSQNENILAFGQLANVNVKPCLTQEEVSLFMKHLTIVPLDQSQLIHLK